MSKQEDNAAVVGCMALLFVLAVRLGVLGFVLWLAYTLVMWLVGS